MACFLCIESFPIPSFPNCYQDSLQFCRKNYVYALFWTIIHKLTNWQRCTKQLPIHFHHIWYINDQSEHCGESKLASRNPLKRVQSFLNWKMDPNTAQPVCNRLFNFCHQMFQVFGNSNKSCKVKKLRNLALMIYFWLFENNYVVVILLRS